MFAYLKRKYHCFKYRRFADWQDMLDKITNVDRFILMMFKMFDDDVYTEQRFNILEIFTKDLCSFRQTNVYHELFILYKKKHVKY